jgi:hypothetical protein
VLSVTNAKKSWKIQQDQRHKPNTNFEDFETQSEREAFGKITIGFFGFVRLQKQ